MKLNMLKAIAKAETQRIQMLADKVSPKGFKMLVSVKVNEDGDLENFATDICLN